MKTYRPARDLIAEVKRVLARKASFRRSPLSEIIELLCRGRHYSWMGIYLVVGGNSRQQLLQEGMDASHPGQIRMPETRTKILVEMRLAGREVGVLDVESPAENAFGGEDRVLLENVAMLLARFLTGPGKYVARKARGKAVSASTVPARGPQSAPAVRESKTAAVGEK